MKIAQFTVCFCVDDEVEYLKTGISDRDVIISKLLKEKSQLQDRVEEQSIKETSSIGVQFNPSMGNSSSIGVQFNPSMGNSSSIGLQFDYLIPSMGKSIIV